MPTSHVVATKVRIVVFGSFYRGYYVLHELLHGDISQHVEVVGVATDDATQAFVSPTKRVWQYPHALSDRTMVQSLAASHGIKVYNGRVKTPEFYTLMSEHWKPDLCIMATFGQKISAELFEAPRLGFYNLHPCIEDGWPSKYVGGNPFQALLDSHTPSTVIAMHRVDGGFDTGELIAYSERVAIPPHVGVVDLHKITAPVAGRLAAAQISKIIDRDRTRQAQ
jgi:methionyl-tRNA formyltransferase